MRGATFYPSSDQTITMVKAYAPEAVELADRALAIVHGKEVDQSEALQIGDDAVRLFYKIYPESEY